jgi:phage tail sheath protein FI
MSARKFKFISPGVFLNEIDNSQLPNEPREIGPLFVGRAKYGPAMRPVTVDSFAEFVQLYGEPIPGGKSDDVWRNGNEQTPTYGTYAAQAWLRNSSTCTYMRLLGSQNAAAETGGEAGWKLTGQVTDAYDINTTPSASNATGSAWGLFVMQNNLSSSAGASATGSLVATWYVEDGLVGLVGRDGEDGEISSNQVGRGIGRLVGSDSSGLFTVTITGSSGNSYKNRVIRFSLDETRKDYIRNVFNTNPVLVNPDITNSDQRERYWLGETYANDFLQKIADRTVTGSGGAAAGSIGNSEYVGVILPLVSGSGESSETHGSRQIPFEDGATRYNPATGWVFAQDTETSGNFAYSRTTDLFKFHALDHAEWAQNNLKISIVNINYSQDQFNKYGTFDVLVRRANDTDAAPIVVERFSNCNLDQNSLDFIARKIGDSYVQFNSTTRRLETRGEYANNSKYIRVEMKSDDPVNEELLPFGFYGPLKYKDLTIDSVSNAATNFGSNAYALGASQILNTGDISDAANNLVVTGTYFGVPSNSAAPRIKLLYPSHQLRLSGNQDGLADQTDAFWGVWTGKSKTSNKFNRDYADLNRNKSDGLSSQLNVTNQTDYQFVFTLDEVVSGSSNGLLTWVSGSRADGTALSSTGSNDYKNVIDYGVDQFTMPLYGGSDGLDITEKDPFRITLLDGKTETNNYAYNSVKEAIDIIRDPEFVPYNLVSVPGITNEQLTTHLINTAEARADALAVIDLKGDFQPSHEDDKGKQYPNLSDTITNLKNRQINSSYGCAYYPFVQIRDTLQGQLVYMPASVAAIGAMSYTDRVRAPWFAPAGFNRGGLSSGVAGLPVVNVTQKLTAQDRDLLYDANINPIASFPNEGIVIFGQKTLQVTRSALDRINVRRLLIFIKKGISNIAAGVLFEPNVRATWARFIGQANPFLADVQARFGLDEYKLVLDETTTTPDLIDRNILYAKVYLKPTRAIEFVAVDFIITNTGASFED